VTLAGLGTIFLVVNVVTALSILGASFLAEKIGNLRTMVYTHLLSNVFLMMIPLAGSLAGALLFLVLRQSVSQMDVPARQAFIASVFNERDRISAIAITNTLRSVSSIFGAPLSGFAFGAGLSSLPILAGGFAKILYDAVIFVTYRGRAR
jgi:MFS family permease